MLGLTALPPYRLYMSIVFKFWGPQSPGSRPVQALLYLVPPFSSFPVNSTCTFTRRKNGEAWERFKNNVLSFFVLCAAGTHHYGKSKNHGVAKTQYIKHGS